jgi:hypothetical protein
MSTIEMGWHYDLNVKCVIHPDFVDFYRNEYLMKFKTYCSILSDHTCNENCENTCHAAYIEEYRDLPRSYKDLIQCWLPLDIASFYGYTLEESTFTLHISKKVNKHEGNLWNDYETFLHDILVPTTTEITFCTISEDDYGCTERMYTDLELRGQHLNLQQLVRSLHHIWEDGVIVETRVVYKRGLPANQKLDLERLYNRGY